MANQEISKVEELQEELRLKQEILRNEKNIMAMTELKDTSVIPKSLNGKLAIAAQFAQSNIVPDSYRGKPQDVFIALQYGEMLGFINPFSCIQNIYVVQGRPSASSDSMVGAVFNQPEFLDYEHKIEYLDSEFTAGNQKYKDIKSTTIITKKMPSGKEKVFERSHLLSMSKNKLKSFPEWQNDPENMLKHRSDSKCCRSAFPNIFAGLHNPDEVYDAVQNDKERYAEVQDGKGNIIGKEKVNPSDDVSETLDLD